VLLIGAQILCQDHSGHGDNGHDCHAGSGDAGDGTPTPLIPLPCKGGEHPEPRALERRV
jgi:hypothetical protein